MGILSGIVLRIVPLAMTTFTTFFGAGIASIIRLMTVFWASCSPILMATLAPHSADPSLPVGPATVLGVASAIYCGGVGTFAAMKKPNLGVAIQGMSVGMAGSVVIEAFVVAWVREQIDPATVDYLLPWFLMIFRLACGGYVVKLFIRFADARDIGSTVVTGAIGSLQVFVSFGFDFAKSLNITALMAGDFGCASWGCYTTLVFFFLFAAVGLKSQLYGAALEKKRGTEGWEPSGKFEKLQVKLNSQLKLLFSLDSALVAAGEASRTPEELAGATGSTTCT